MMLQSQSWQSSIFKTKQSLESEKLPLKMIEKVKDPKDQDLSEAVMYLRFFTNTKYYT